MKMTRLKQWLAAALVAGAGAFAYADAEETVVATAEPDLWMGPDEIVEAWAEATFDLGPGTTAITLPTGVATHTYVVSNLTDGAEGEIPSSGSTAGGATYELPIGAHVAIYCIPAAGYTVQGTNPYDIPEVTDGLTIDPTALPKGAVPASATLVSVAQRYPWNGKVDVTVDIEGVKKVYSYSLGLVFTVNGETKGVTNKIAKAADGVNTVTVDGTKIFPAGTVAADAHIVVELIEDDAGEVVTPFCVTAEEPGLFVGFIDYGAAYGGTPWSGNLECSRDGKNWTQCQKSEIEAPWK